VIQRQLSIEVTNIYQELVSFRPYAAEPSLRDPSFALRHSGSLHSLDWCFWQGAAAVVVQFPEDIHDAGGEGYYKVH
jgi:hypothetical protein